jgi:hypothetical protein
MVGNGLNRQPFPVPLHLPRHINVEVEKKIRPFTWQNDGDVPMTQFEENASGCASQYIEHRLGNSLQEIHDHVRGSASCRPKQGRQRAEDHRDHGAD